MIDFRRITSNGLYLEQADGLRCLAVLCVLFYHLAGELEKFSGSANRMAPGSSLQQVLGANAARGVSLFFVLAAMLLAIPFARQHLQGAKPVSLRAYFLRRLTRLDPPYALCVLLDLVLTLVYEHPREPHLFAHFWATFFYQHNLIYGTGSSLNVVFWSLEIDVQFYCIAPLLMTIYRIPRALLRRGLLLSALVACALCDAPMLHHPRLELSVLFYLPFFFAGLLAADFYVCGTDGKSRRWPWDLVGCSALAGMFLLPKRGHVNLILIPLALLLLCMAATRSGLLSRLLALRPVTLVGGMCYSIYLLHMIFLPALFRVTRYAVLNTTFSVNFLLQIIVTALPILLLSSIFYLLVERPCMDPAWPAKLWRKLAPPSRQAQA